MAKLVEIVFPIIEYISLIKRYILQREKYSQQSRNKNVIPHLVNFEKFSLTVTYFSITILILLDFSFTSDHRTGFLIGILFLFSLLSLLFLHAKISSIYFSHFYSIYYILIFLIFFIAPRFTNEISRSFEENFVLTITIILLQSFRSGKYTAMPVISILLIIYIYICNDNLVNSGNVRYYYIFLLFWASGISLIFESVLYYISMGFLELREKNEREKHELFLSRLVYNNFFPKFTENEQIKFHVWRSEQNQAGGDFYDLIQLREKNMGIFFADISGHGVSSAIMAGALKMILQNRPYLEKINPEKLLSQLDNIFHKNYASHHASAVYIFFNFIEMKAALANAGHPPVLFSEGGGPFRELQTTGSIIGYNLRKPIADAIEIPIKKGDRFLFYTDGLTDYNTIENTIAIVENLDEIANRSYKLKSDELITEITHQIESLPDFLSFRDDIVISVIEVL